MFKILRLSEQEFSANPGLGQYVTVRTGSGEGEDAFAHVLLGDFRTFMTQVVNTRIDVLADEVANNSGPSIWPAARTMTLSGAVTGSASFDGSQNFSVVTSIADASLSIAKTSGLQTALDGKLDTTGNAATATRLQTSRNIALTGIVTGTASFNGSANASIATSIADAALSIAKTSGLQAALDGKANLAGADFTGPVSTRGVGLDVWAGDATSDARLGLRNNAGLGQGWLMWDRATDSIRLRRAAGDGTTTEGDLAVYGDRVTFNGSTLYHSGNLDASALSYLSAAVTEYASGAGADCNAFAAGTKVIVHNTNANTPGTSSPYWYIETVLISTSNNTLIQRAYSNSADEHYFRRCNAGVWGTWRRQWNSGNFNPTSKLDSNAVAASASKLQTPRAITLTGAVAGTGSFDGTADLSITTTVADASLTIAQTAGLQTALDGKMSTGAYGLGTAPQNFNWGAEIRESQFAAGTTGSPESGKNYMGMHVVLGNANYYALDVVGRNNKLWFKTVELGTQGSWLEIFHTGNFNPANYVPTTRSVLAGNGIIGGGTLGSDATLTLGTPGTLSGTTANAVTTGSHTHALSTNLKAWDAITVASKLDATATAAAATKLATARTVALTGIVTATGTFDGTANLSLATSVADAALSIAKVSGLQAALDALAPKNNATFSGTTTLTGDLLPDLDNTRSLGAPNLMWKDVYIGPGSLYINGQKVLEDNSGTIRMLADPNQNIAIQTSGSGDIELAPTGTGVIQMKGTVSFLGGSKIRSSNGAALLFDDDIQFTAGTGLIGTPTVNGNVIYHAGNLNLGSRVEMGTTSINADGTVPAGYFSDVAGQLALKYSQNSTGSTGFPTEFGATVSFVMGKQQSRTFDLHVTTGSPNFLYYRGYPSTGQAGGEWKTIAAVQNANTWTGTQTFSNVVTLASDRAHLLGTGGGTLRATSTGSVVLSSGTNASGFIYMRPNGDTVTTGQSVFYASGQFETPSIKVGQGVGAGGVMLELSGDRAWQFRQVGTGATSGLELFDAIGGKKFDISTTSSSKKITIDPNVSTVYADTFAGTATGAAKWSTARTVTLGGDLVGNFSLDGTSDVTVTGRQRSYQHTGTGSAYAGQYVRIARATLAALYEDSAIQLEMMGYGDGSTGSRKIHLSFRIKQQANLPALPYVNVEVDRQNYMNPEDFYAVIGDTSAYPVTVDLYAKMSGTYSGLKSTVVARGGSRAMEVFEGESYISALPAGTVIQGVGDNSRLYAGTVVAGTDVTIAGNSAWHAGNLSKNILHTTDTTSSGDLRFASSNGRGVRFWDNDQYKIFMSAATDTTFGGRVAGETTSDYNMYFRMASGTNRGFVFETAYATKLFSINPNGVRSVPSITAPSFIGALTGNATTASSAAKLTTARAINGVAFDGSADITISATWGGGVVNNSVNIFRGTASTQTTMLTMGWSTGSSRWAHVFESDASYALYSYTSTGSNPTSVVQINNVASGASAFDAMRVYGGIKSIGASATIGVGDRGTGSEWNIYASSNIMRFWWAGNPAGDKFAFGSDGQLAASRARLSAEAPLHFTFGDGGLSRIYAWGTSGAGDDMFNVLRNGTSNYNLFWNGNMEASNTLRVGNQIYLNGGWFRTQQSGCGWYHEVHGGGWFMQDNTWIRTYNGRGVLVAGPGGSTGDIRLESTSPTITFYDTDQNTTHWLHCNDNNIGFLASNSFSWATYRNGSNDWVCVGNIVGYSSDERLKHHIYDVDRAIPTDFFNRFKVREFDWDYEAIAELNPNFKPIADHEVGGIAQEVEEIYPFMVATHEETGIKTIMWDKAVPLLISEVQELRKLKPVVDELLARLAKLEETVGGA